MQYRKIAGDRSEKNAKYLPHAIEFTGISSFMLDWTRKEAEQELDRAYQNYARTFAHRYWYSFTLITFDINYYSVHSTLILVEVLRIQRNFKEMVTVLLRAAERQESDDLSSALFQEQAAFGYLSLSPPLFRKFALRLVFAGNRFVIANQEKHAYRCYTFTDGIYTGKYWTHIESRIFHE